MDVLKNCNFLDRVVRQSGESGRRPVQPDGTSGVGRPSLSCPRREGVLLAAGGGERTWHFNYPQRSRKCGFQLHPTLLYIKKFMHMTCVDD